MEAAKLDRRVRNGQFFLLVTQSSMVRMGHFLGNLGAGYHSVSLLECAIPEEGDDRN
jgi:hypothetical protein